MFEIGDIWCWTRNSAEHPDDPNYNYFMILDDEWGYGVLYLIDGRRVTYSKQTFTANLQYLEKVA